MYHVSTGKYKKDRDLEEQWSQFLNGYWTLDKPYYTGYYIVCARDGILAYQKHFRKREDLQKWEGWFWSVPLPPPPKEVPVDNG